MMRDHTLVSEPGLNDSESMDLCLPQLISDTESDDSLTDSEMDLQLEISSATSSPRHLALNPWHPYQDELPLVYDQADSTIDELIYWPGPVFIKANTTFTLGLIGYTELHIGPDVTVKFEAQAMPIDNHPLKFNLDPTAQLICKKTHLKYQESIDESSFAGLELNLQAPERKTTGLLFQHKRKRALSEDRCCESLTLSSMEFERAQRPRLNPN